MVIQNGGLYFDKIIYFCNALAGVLRTVDTEIKIRSGGVSINYIMKGDLYYVVVHKLSLFDHYTSLDLFTLMVMLQKNILW